MTMEIKEIKLLNKALDEFGADKQLLQTVEELNELSVAILHYLKKRRDVEYSLIEEIVDVEIMIDQLKILFEDNYDFKKIRQKKLDKLDTAILVNGL